jgi:hypothetical protein
MTTPSETLTREISRQEEVAQTLEALELRLESLRQLPLELRALSQSLQSCSAGWLALECRTLVLTRRANRR